MENIMTVPTPISDVGVVYATGNHYVSLSEIRADGTVCALSHLRESTNALIEYVGEPLFECLLNGVPLPAGEHCYTHDFIPTFACQVGQLRIERRLFAPEGIRGFVVRAELTAQEKAVGTLTLRCVPQDFRRAVFKPRPLAAQTELGLDDWTGCAYLEVLAGGGITALAMGGGENMALDGTIAVRRSFDLAAGEREVLWYYISVGAELDGARLANIDMRRRGADLYASHVARLDARHVTLPNDPLLERMANLNLNFCYYFSMGYALDTHKLMLTTSKSSRYYVSGAYWARDCMLWAFPALLRVNPALAKQALLQACTIYLEKGAEHALYVNGVSLYPGFELDELVAPMIALERYVTKTGDAQILELPEITHAMEFTWRTLLKWRDEATGLFATELSPSDDPEEYPFLTYDNCLALATLRFLSGKAGDLAEIIAALERGLECHCQADGLLVWSTNGKGQAKQYDNPPGSLILTAYYGGLGHDDPVWKKTANFYFSEQNPWYTQNDRLFGQGCAHAPEPWPMSLCNLLLVRGRQEGTLAALRAMTMDNGIACETVHAADGTLCTGAAFATAAGFLANAIVEAYEN